MVHCYCLSFSKGGMIRWKSKRMIRDGRYHRRYGFTMRTGALSFCLLFHILSHVAPAQHACAPGTCFTSSLLVRA